MKYILIILLFASSFLNAQILPGSPTEGRPRPGWNLPINLRGLTPPDTGMVMVSEIWRGKQPAPFWRYTQDIVAAASSAYTHPAYTPGSVLFAGADGQPTEDNTKLFFDDALNNLRIGTNSTLGNEPLTVFRQSPGTYNIIASFSAGNNITENKSKFSISTTEGSVGLFLNHQLAGTNALLDVLEHETEFGFPSNVSSSYAARQFRVRNKNNTSIGPANRPWYRFVGGSPSTSGDYSKMALIVGMGYTSSTSTNDHRGGTFLWYPEARAANNHYANAVPNSVAYYNSLGLLLRTTPNQLQVTDPTTAATSDLSVALTNINNNDFKVTSLFFDKNLMTLNAVVTDGVTPTTVTTSYAAILENYALIADEKAFMQVAGGSTSFVSGTPERLDGDTPGTTTDVVSSAEWSLSGSVATYSGETKLFEVEAIISGATGSVAEATYYIAKNGVLLGEGMTRSHANTDIGVIEVSWIVSIAPTDEIDVRVDAIADETFNNTNYTLSIRPW